MKTIIGLILIAPMAIMLLTTLIYQVSWMIDRRTEEWKNKTKEEYLTEFLFVFIFISIIWIITITGVQLLTH